MKISPITYVYAGAAQRNKNKKEYSPATVATIATGSTILTGAFCYSLFAIKSGASVSNAKMNKNNFLKLCKNAKPEFYNASTINVHNKTFRMDLHSHSNHSDGYGRVPEILEQVAKYADDLHAKTGEKFTFSLTDHDRVSGVKEALETIKKEPEKYKNINFIPGVEFSFTFVSNGEVKAGELLAYNINPDSKEINELLNNVSKNRLYMIDECIKQLGVGFKRSEMDGYFLNKDGESFAYFLHYRLRNYAQIKNRINNIALEQGKEIDTLYKNLMDGFIYGGGKRRPKPFTDPNSFDEYLKSIRFKTQTPIIDRKVDEICERFYPKVIDGKVVSNAENSFEKIIDTLKEDKEIILGFAHPYFTLSRMKDYKTETEAMLKYAQGKILLSENYHQAYPPHVPKDKLEEINQFLLDKKLIPIGGRDNHKPKFL